MGWDDESVKKKKAPSQQELFRILTSEEQSVVDILTQNESLHIDQLARELEIPSYQLSFLLLDMEMKGIIKNMPGNMYVLG